MSDRKGVVLGMAHEGTTRGGDLPEISPGSRIHWTPLERSDRPCADEPALRFGEIHAAIPGISDRLLAERLKRT